MGGVAHFITGHGQTQTELSIFISFVYFLLLKDLTVQNLFLSYKLLCAEAVN